MIAFLLSQGAATLTALSWKTYGLLLALGAGLALWLWISGLRADLAEIQREKATLRRHVALQRSLLAERDRALEAVAEAARRADALRRSSQKAREEAIHAPQADDGPLAPVLRRALERLR